MNNLEFTPIDSLPAENLAVVKFGVNRIWKITTLILTIINLLFIIIVILVVLKQKKLCNSTNELITTTTTTIKIETISPIDITTIKNEMICESKENGSIIPIDLVCIYPAYYRTFPLSTLRKLPTSIGLSLNHSLYYNIPHESQVQGYITSISLRLYTNWEGNDPLYIYNLMGHSIRYHQITHRYPIFPKRNNTDWQTIKIPLQKFPIVIGSFIGIGMQDRKTTNQIYALNSILSMYGENITNNTREFFIKPTENLYGVAFIYTVLEDDENIFH